MTNRKIIFTIICAVAIAITVLVTAETFRDRTDSIEVTVPFKGSMSDYKSVVIRARFTSVSQWLNRSQFYEHFIEETVQKWVRNNGMELVEISRDKESRRHPDLRIIVETDIETGIPYFGRHFNVMFWHYGHINIRFTDPKNEEVVGEAHYTRPFLTMSPADIFAMMLDKIVRKRYGLTDFGTWERRNFPKSHISLDLPAGFYGYHDSAFRKDYPDKAILSLRFHEGKSKDRVYSGLTVFFNEMTPDRYSEVKEAVDRATHKDTKEYLQWLSAFHGDVSKRDELPVNGPYTIYIRDYRNRQGRTVRARADLNFRLRPEGPSADDQAIRRMLNSVEIQ